MKTKNKLKQDKNNIEIDQKKKPNKNNTKNNTKNNIIKITN